MTEKLDETNFLLFAARSYENLHCYDTLEFYEDLNRFKYIKRLFNRYEETGELKERLIINHLIVIYNVFGVEASTRMLFFKLREYHHYLKPFLSLMGYLPDTVCGIGIEGKDYKCDQIPDDKQITQKLKEI